MPTTTAKSPVCGYHVIGRDEVKPPSEGPLRRQVDAVPDFRWIDIGAFSIEVREVKDWALPHPMTPALTDEDQRVLSETIHRSRRVLMPVFIDQDGRLLHGAESILAVAAIQTSEEPVQIETIPAIYLHVEDQAAEAELMLALNVGRAGGSQSELNERRRAAVRTLLLAGHDGTDRLIATLCGLRDSSVVKSVRLELEASGEIERREAFVDRRGGIQKRQPDYDERAAPEANAEVSGADTSEAPKREAGVETEEPVTDSFQQIDEAPPAHRPESTFMGRWHAAFGSAPMWPEQVASLASEMGDEVPKASGSGDGYRWTVYPKPDQTDRVIVVEREA